METVLRGPPPWEPEQPGRRPWEPEPSRPAQPGRPDLPDAPTGDAPAGLPPWLAQRMYEQRIVVLTGPITAASAATATAALLSLDRSPTGFAGVADDPPPGQAAVQLHLAAPDGDLDAVLSIVDTLDTLRVPVHALATAEVGGAAVGVYAAATRRLAYPHARFRLAEPKLARMSGTADDVASAAGRHLRSLEDLIVRVAQATGQPRSRVEDDFSTGTLLDAAQAREYGLVHDIRART